MTDFVPYAFGALGVAVVALAYAIRPWLARRHAVRLDARLTRGTDLTHDELRSLQTYTPEFIHKMLLSMGVALMLFCLHLILPDTLASAHSYLQSLRT